MAKYIAVWNVFTSKGIKAPGESLDLTEDEAATLPEGSIRYVGLGEPLEPVKTPGPAAPAPTEPVPAVPTEPAVKSQAKGSKADPQPKEQAAAGGASQ